MNNKLSHRWMPSSSKKLLCSVPWRSRPVHWLGLICKASFCLLPHSLVEPHLFPLRNSPNGERVVSKRCVSRWKVIADCLPLGKNHPIYAILWHCGRGTSIGIGPCFVPTAGTPRHTFAPRLPCLAENGKKFQKSPQPLPATCQGKARNSDICSPWHQQP